MKDYYNLFVKLSLQQCEKDDYKSKLKVKEHNAAAKKLNRLCSEIREIDSSECNRILYCLLLYDDNRVKLNAATLCLQMNVNVSEAVEALNNVIKESDDAALCFSAKMVLQQTNNSQST